MGSNSCNFFKSEQGEKTLKKALYDAINSEEYGRKVLSDFKAKIIRAKLDRGEDLTEEDIHLFDDKLKPKEEHEGPITEKYADNIQNYEYNYKPEAKNIDPSIDPSETEIGPMAQDIEKVNPSAIVETEGGIKTVDINKLCLMNAGAIADLARDIKQIKEMLNGGKA